MVPTVTIKLNVEEMWEQFPDMVGEEWDYDAISIEEGSHFWNYVSELETKYAVLINGDDPCPCFLGWLEQNHDEMPSWKLVIDELEKKNEEKISTFVVRLERPMYDKHNALIAMMTIKELEFDTIEEAQYVFNNYTIEPVGELLYLDEIEKMNEDDGDQENIDSRGKLVHEEEEEEKEQYCEWLRLKDIDCGDDKTLEEFKAMKTLCEHDRCETVGLCSLDKCFFETE